MFIVSLEYAVDPDTVEPYRMAHMAWVREGFERGVFIASGRKSPPSGGIILAREASRERLTAWLNEDPFIVAGVAQYHVEEFLPTTVGNGFEGLKGI
ncbi:MULTISPECIES: YciI family protein [Chromohalobacter]|uniref:YciI family protein n=1 Tax=Chromohalobacter TaxID=42054 RepID=UPI00058DE352|nr:MULTISPECIES: YciI family protein [Chromohalobacter]